MQLGQTEFVGTIDDDGVGARHVDAAFDDRGADQDIETLVVEVAHDAFELAFTHLAVGETRPVHREPVRQPSRGLRDRRYFVVQQVDLAAAVDSRWQASRISTSFHWLTKVLIRMAGRGGVAMIDRSRMPDIAMFSVRGIGVAVRVRMSTSARSAFRRSLCRTPKRCCSSMITRPRSLNLICSLSSLCVPTTMSIWPCSQARRPGFSLAERKRAQALDLDRPVGETVGKFW